MQGFIVNLNEDNVEYIMEPSTFDHDTEEPFPSPHVVDSHSLSPTESTPSIMARHPQGVKKGKPFWLTSLTPKLLT